MDARCGDVFFEEGEGEFFEVGEGLSDDGLGFWGEEEVLDLRVGFVDCCESFEEFGADDAAALPDAADFAEIYLPVLLLGGCVDEVQALGVAEQHAEVEGVF